MYTIANVIYGIPITDEIYKLFNDEILNKYPDFDENQDFTILYSGGADRTVGYCGVELYEFDECDDFPLNEITGGPTEEEKEEVHRMIDALPQEIKDVMPKIDVWVVWSTS